MNYLCLAGTVAIATLSLSAGAQQTPRATTVGPLMPPTEEAKAPTLPSPAAVAEIKLGGRAVTVHYNTPHVRGRAIMGSLVPYGKVWRTGANPATSFTTAADLIIGNLHVPAGRYTLYTLPAPPGTPWLLILSKETGQWGTVYHQDQDLGRISMQADELASVQEIMSISFTKKVAEETQLHVRWEHVDEWVEIRLSK